MLNFIKPEPLIDGLAIARGQQAINDEMERRRANPQPIKLEPLPPLTNWFDAREARLNFELLPDGTRPLKDAQERQFELCQEISRFEKILADDPSDYERRSILGWEQKSLTLPGELQQYKHVEGLMELKKAELAQLERELPLLERKSAMYERQREQLRDWTTARIDMERRKAHERSMIADGKAVEPRFW